MRLYELDLEAMSEDDLVRACLDDDELYAELALHVVSDGKTVPFIYNEPQRILTEACNKQLKERGKVQMLVLKARQMGLSTIIQGRGFKRATTSENYRMEVISHDDDSAAHILGMSKLFLDMLPGRFKPMTKYQPKTNLYFANPDRHASVKDPGLRSSITVTTARNARGGRSKTPHFLHFSEVAFYDRAPEKLVGGYMQGLPASMQTEVFLESTANGNEGYFYDIWRDAIKGLNGWHPLFLPWWSLSKYRVKPPAGFTYDKEEDRLRERFELDDEQLWWRRMTLRDKCSGDLLLFKQEYPSDWLESFQSSGSKFFPALKLQEMYDVEEKEEAKNPPRRGTVVRDVSGKPVWVDDPQGWTVLHEEPSPDMAYIVTVDASEGNEAEDRDPSGILVTTAPADAVKLDEEVLEYNGWLDPDLLAEYAELIGEWYNWAYLAHEDNNHGVNISAVLRRDGYPCVMEREVVDEVTFEVVTKIGFHTDAKTKPYALNLLKAAIREGTYRIRTTAAIAEHLAFKKSKVAYKGGLYSGNAPSGQHDERVIVRAINRVAASVAPRSPAGRVTSYRDVAANYVRR